MCHVKRVGLLCGLLALFATGCSDDPAAGVDTTSDQALPVVVATTNILGDVLSNLAGGQFEVITVMPVGSDPHLFQPSARDVAMITGSSAIVANGASFEEGLLDAIDSARDEGLPVFDAISAVEPLSPADDRRPARLIAEDESDGNERNDGHTDSDHHDGDEHPTGDRHNGDHHDEAGDDHDEHDHVDEGDGHGHDHRGASGVDPHFFADPARMADAVDGIADFLIEHVDRIDADVLTDNAQRYIAELDALDEQVASLLADVPPSQRVLVTNHQVYAYFADRYGFEVIGTVLPAGSSTDGVSGRRLTELAALLERQGISVLFVDRSASDDLAHTLAGEVGNVDVIELYTESLGEADSDGATYVEMVRSNARHIADALANPSD